MDIWVLVLNTMSIEISELQGKLQGYTIDDALSLARDNGIKKPATIINEVAAAIRGFREFAQECGVSQRWIASIKMCLNEHLFFSYYMNISFQFHHTQMDGAQTSRFLEKV